MQVVFVHGACVRDGAWWWHRTAALLEAAGVTSSAPLLPSCGETGAAVGTDGPSLAEDVASVRAHLSAIDEPVVAVAHSYGGVVLAEAAAGLPHVQHLVLIASFMPEPGQSLSSFGGDGPAPYLLVDPEDGTFGVRYELATETFLQDCLAEDIGHATARMVRQSVSVTQQPVRAAAWQEIDSTYVVCADDRGTPPSLQREMAQRATRVVEVDAGHHVMLSQPAVVADLVLGLG